MPTLLDRELPEPELPERELPEPAVAELAGGLRSVINRLAFLLRSSAATRGITPTRLTALVALDKAGPQRLGDLAAMLGITAASMSRLSDALEEGQWVRKAADPDDQRAFQLSITAHGVTTLEGLRREGTSQLTHDILSLTAEQRALLAAALPVLVALADRHLGQLPGG